MEEEPQKVLEIAPNSSLDEIWDLCVRNFLYDQEKYINQLEAIFSQMGITKESRLADVSAGGGFPAINLASEGYQIDCFDGFAANLFNSNAHKLGQDISCQKALWSELPSLVSDSSYDLVFCRGNSFIFAGGGWDRAKDFNQEEVLQKYQETANIFFSLLKTGGYLYIDKFKDSELGHREKLATINVGGDSQDLIFSSQRSPGEKIRRVFMERESNGEVVDKEIRVTYDLSGEELVAILKKAGFSSVEPVTLEEEKHFDIWLAKK